MTKGINLPCHSRNNTKGSIQKPERKRCGRGRREVGSEASRGGGQRQRGVGSEARGVGSKARRVGPVSQKGSNADMKTKGTDRQTNYCTWDCKRDRHMPSQKGGQIPGR